MQLKFRQQQLGVRRAGGVMSTLLFLVFCVSSFVPQKVLADPVIAQLTLGTVTSTTAVITWTTNIPSDSFISYVGTGDSSVKNFQDDNLVTSHKLTLIGLRPETRYSFTVNSADAEGNNISASGSAFTTLSGPITTAPPPSQEDQDPTEADSPTGLQFAPVTQPFISGYPTGTLAQEGSTIYFLMAKDAVKIPFSNLAAFTGLGYKLQNVQKVDISAFRASMSYIISSAAEEHPWGTWLRAGNGTLYYSHSSGLIGVPSMSVFTANGGTVDMVMPLNAADKKLLQANPGLPVLQPQDDRIL